MKRTTLVAVVACGAVIAIVVGVPVGIDARQSSSKSGSSQTAPAPSGSNTSGRSGQLQSAAVQPSAVKVLASHSSKLASPPAKKWKKLRRNVAWQWQLSDEGTIARVPGVTMYDVDIDTAASQIRVLRNAVKGVQVICYISVGTWESYRQRQDRRRRGIRPSDWKGLLGKSYSPPFSDERWIDIRSSRVRKIMSKRFDFAKKIGCDGIEPDNTGAHEEDTGFNIHRRDALAYSHWIASAVHRRGMSVGLKNTMSLLPQLHKSYDWFLNEQCSADHSCSAYNIVGTSKPVLGAEYCDATAQGNGVTQDPGCYCPGLLAANFNWLIKDTDVDAKRTTCKAYCAKHSCPGRKGRKTCNAGKSSICSAVFK